MSEQYNIDALDSGKKTCEMFHDIFVHESGLERVQGTKNETLTVDDMFHGILVHSSGLGRAQGTQNETLSPQSPTAISTFLLH